MPLVSIEEIQPHISESILKGLQANGRFTAVENEAAKFIKGRTGISIPESVADRDEAVAQWVILPAAWIIQYIGRNCVSNKSPELERSISEQYAEAKKILDTNITRPLTASTTQSYSVGQIEGMYE